LKIQKVSLTFKVGLYFNGHPISPGTVIPGLRIGDKSDAEGILLALSDFGVFVVASDIVKVK
jgi:hypothetical protein